MGNEYEREWTVPIADPGRVTRLRVGLTTDGGRLLGFLVQLEAYRDGAWRGLARFEHDRGRSAHDADPIRGLALERSTPAGDWRRVPGEFPPVDERAAVSAAALYLKRHYRALVGTVGR